MPLPPHVETTAAMRLRRYIQPPQPALVCTGLGSAQQQAHTVGRLRAHNGGYTVGRSRAPDTRGEDERRPSETILGCLGLCTARHAVASASRRPSPGSRNTRHANRPQPLPFRRSRVKIWIRWPPNGGLGVLDLRVRLCTLLTGRKNTQRGGFGCTTGEGTSYRNIGVDTWPERGGES